MCKELTSLAQDPAIRKFPGMVGGLKARQLMLSSGGEVTSTSFKEMSRTQVNARLDSCYKVLF